MSDILFQITTDHLDTGMRGFPVGKCTTSYVDAEKGLFYRGKSIREIAAWEPIRAIYLLMFGSDATPEKAASFKADLVKRSVINPKVLEAISKLPKEGHPMALLPASLLLLGMFESEKNYEEDGLNLIAKLPHLIAHLINTHAGWQETSPPNMNLGYMESFVEMLNPPDVNKEEILPLMKLFNILHYDHGGGNLSCFVGKAVASGLEGLYGSLSAAMCALAGPRHGRANQNCLAFVKEIAGEIGTTKTPDKVADIIRKKLANKELIHGFGHAVLRVEDPRATLFCEYAEQHFSDNPLVQTALLMRDVVPVILKENPKISSPYPNVDMMSGTLLTAAGFSYPQYYTVLFGMSRLVGITIQIVHERIYAREGKGLPIVRPKYIYQPK